VILSGKTLVVSGVGAGLGREVARCALRDGARVVLGARTRSKLEALAKELDPSGERVAPVVADITDEGDCEALARTAAERFGSLDALVQVAALDAVFGGLLDGDLEDWRRTYETNVVGSMRLVRAAVPHLERAGGGSVVLIGSQASLLPLVPQLAYAASKGALLSSMYHLAKELGPRRIRVNTVVPTWMWGPPAAGGHHARGPGGAGHGRHGDPRDPRRRGRGRGRGLPGLRPRAHDHRPVAAGERRRADALTRRGGHTGRVAGAPARAGRCVA
jgi:NAD(P)-dependent dehydrogenase (short-subunit alcohol dehydrogenase family)